MKNTELIKIARTFIGVPYRHQGRSRKGVDCWGLLYAVGSEADVLPDGLNVTADYGMMTDAMMRENVSKWCTLTDKVEDAIIALIRWPGTRFAGHMGILTKEGNIIHAYNMETRVVEHGFRGPWLRMCDSMWKLPGVEYI